jgi:8-oxo-dGTP pyrophosphatase MutT (NUDIX family)
MGLSLESMEKHLEEGLRKRLPGAAAHRLMAPVPRPGWDPEREAPEGRAAAVLILIYPAESSQSGSLQSEFRQAEASGRPPASPDARQVPTIVLTERTASVESHKRQISFPGGVIESGETPEQAALREAYEEVAVPVNLPRILGRLSPLWVPATGFTIQPVVAVESLRPTFSASPREVDRIIEVSVSWLMNPEALCVESAVTRGNWRTFRYFDLDGAKLWGASAMIMAELLVLLGWQGPEIASPGSRR